MEAIRIKVKGETLTTKYNILYRLLSGHSVPSGPGAGNLSTIQPINEFESRN
jgi:hypothetical protein